MSHYHPIGAMFEHLFPTHRELLAIVTVSTVVVALALWKVVDLAVLAWGFLSGVRITFGV